MSVLDEKDLLILRILQDDGGATNAAVGEKVGLSGPSVHERLKRLRAAGVILGERLIVDATAVGRSFLSFVLLKTGGPGKSKQVEALSALPEIEEIHSTAGQFSILLKVRTRSPEDMEDLYEKIYSIPGIIGSESIIAFKTFLERPVDIPLEG